MDQPITHAPARPIGLEHSLASGSSHRAQLWRDESKAEARRPGWIAAGLATPIVGLGLTVQIGWLTHSPTLIQVLPHLPPMTRNTSACFLQCGLAALLSACGAPRPLRLACAAPVVVLSALALIQIAFRVDLGVNEILGTSYINVRLPMRGGMAPLTAICFFLASVALVMTPSAQSLGAAMLLGFNGSIVAAAGLAAVISFHAGVALSALHTGTGFVVLGLALLALAWRANAAAVRAPRWLPVSVAIGVVAGVMGLWRALTIAGHPHLAMLPAAILLVGLAVAPIFALTVYLAQRGHAQAVALRRSEALLSEAQRLSSTGSFYWRVSTCEIRWSDETYRIFGVAAGSAVSIELIAGRFHPDDLPVFDDILASASEGRDLDYEHRLRLDDTFRHVRLVARGRRGHDGGLEYIGAVQDLTERRASEAALTKVRSELAHVTRVMSLGTLTASIAHEVNQPLAGIVTNAGTCLRMLSGEPPDVAGACETARRTIRDGNRAAQVIGRLRALFAKEGADMQKLDLYDAVREVVALTAGDVRRHRASVQIELDPELPAIVADRTQIQQVALNLILNAVDAMATVNDRPRRVVVWTFRESCGVRLCVGDAGVGIDPQMSQKVFEAFYTTKTGGMGVGLSVSLSIVERHGGRIWVETNDGPGVTFFVSLPCGSATTAAPIALSAAPRTST